MGRMPGRAAERWGREHAHLQVRTALPGPGRRPHTLASSEWTASVHLALCWWPGLCATGGADHGNPTGCPCRCVGLCRAGTVGTEGRAVRPAGEGWAKGVRRSRLLGGSFPQAHRPHICGFPGPEPHRKLQQRAGVGSGAPQTLGPLAHIRDLQATFSNKMQISNCLTEELGENQCKQNLCCHGDH